MRDWPERCLARLGTHARTRLGAWALGHTIALQPQQRFAAAGCAIWNEGFNGENCLLLRWRLRPRSPVLTSISLSCRFLSREPN